MAAVVTTSLIVQFGSEDDAENFLLSAEIDSRPEGFNKGVTQFFPGDSPAFLVYSSPELALVFEQSTGGRLSLGTVTIPQEEFIVFANEESKTLSKPPSGTVTLKYLAGVAGATIEGHTIRLPEKGIAVYKANYDSTPRAYRMVNIPAALQGETSFPVVVFITGTSA